LIGAGGEAEVTTERVRFAWAMFGEPFLISL